MTWTEGALTLAVPTSTLAALVLCSIPAPLPSNPSPSTPKTPECPRREVYPYTRGYVQPVTTASTAPARPAPPPPPKTRTVRALVTACSPHDSPGDRAYYQRHGYKGARTGAVCAAYAHLPKGTKIRVPGYYWDAWVKVDAPGGPIIHRAARRGVVQLDVKFATKKEVVQWGSRWLDITILED